MLNLYIYDFYTKYSDIYSSVYIEPPLYIFYTSIHFMCYTQLPPCFSIEGWIYIYIWRYTEPSFSSYILPYSTLHIFLLSPSSTEIYTALPSSSLPPSSPWPKKNILFHIRVVSFQPFSLFHSIYMQCAIQYFGGKDWCEGIFYEQSIHSNYTQLYMNII